MKDVFFSFIHLDKRLCIIFPLEHSHHGRPKTVENNGSNVRYNKINIAFSDWVIVRNLINSKLISELVSSDQTAFLCNNATQV